MRSTQRTKVRMTIANTSIVSTNSVNRPGRAEVVVLHRDQRDQAEDERADEGRQRVLRHVVGDHERERARRGGAAGRRVGRHHRRHREGGDDQHARGHDREQRLDGLQRDRPARPSRSSVPSASLATNAAADRQQADGERLHPEPLAKPFQQELPAVRHRSALREPAIGELPGIGSGMGAARQGKYEERCHGRQSPEVVLPARCHPGYLRRYCFNSASLQAYRFARRGRVYPLLTRDALPLGCRMRLPQAGTGTGLRL